MSGGNGLQSRLAALVNWYPAPPPVEPPPPPAQNPVALEAERFSEWAQDKHTRIEFVEWLDKRLSAIEKEAEESIERPAVLAGCTRARKELLYVRNKIMEWARFANQGPSQGELNG